MRVTEAVDKHGQMWQIRGLYGLGQVFNQAKSNLAKKRQIEAQIRLAKNIEQRDSK